MVVSRLLLTLGLATLVSAQTTPTPKQPAHRATTAARRPVAAAARSNPADHPPNVPAVAGTPRPMYSLRYLDVVVGTGELAAPQMYYTVRYTGWLTDGTKFDSSDDHPGKDPITFPYGARRVIAGWDTGFEGMRVGGKRRLFIPYQLAYGEPGRPPTIPPKSDLIFDIELVGISAKPPAPAEDPSATPPQGTPPPQGSAPAATPPAGSSAPTAKPETPPQN